MRVLRKDLYSDAKAATYRELSTNALDSHIKAGNTNPIKVTLPTSINPTFIVSDEGTGLSPDDIRDIYSVFGASTKRDSEDETGMLGFGCKAPLAYALSFTLEAVKDNLRTIAMVTVDETDVGTIKILDKAPTVEPNGVTVSVPVKTHDVDTFNNGALEFFRYWRPGTVLVDGEVPEGLTGDAVWLDPDVAVFNLPARDSKLVMGSVAYPFTPAKFTHKIVVWAPMGSVDFTPAREALQMTALTKETIATIEAFVNQRFAESLRTKLETVKTKPDFGYGHFGFGELSSSLT